MVRVITIGLVLASLLPANPASAQATSSRDRALDLFEESAALYDQERFAEAAVLLRRAHELHPEPALLFNLGRALEADGDSSGAIEAYRQYLEGAEEGSEQQLYASERVAALESAAEASAAVSPEPAAQEPAPQDVDAEPERGPTPEPPPPTSSPAPWVLLGVGAAIAAAGAVTGGLALVTNREAEDPATNQQRAEELDAKARRLALSTDVLLPVGAAVAVGALLWALLRPPPVELYASPSSALLVVRSHF